MNEKKIIIVTGGSEGIGLATGALFHSQGHQVILVGRSPEKLRAAQAKLPDAVVFPADVSQAEDVDRLFEQMVEQFGRVDVVVHAASSFHSGALAEASDDDWSQQRKNMDMTVYVNRAAAAQMEKQGYGTVVNISSRAGLREEVLPESSLYAAAKGHMVNLTVSANQENEKVRFLVICPGAVLTKMGEEAAQRRSITKEDYQKTALEPLQVAEAIAKIIAEAKLGSPTIFRITKEDGLQAVTKQGW